MADTIILGDAWIWTFGLVGAGQTFTRTVSQVDGSSFNWVPVFADLGSGAYEASYTPATVGLWEWIGTSTDGTPIEIRIVVETAAAVTVTPGLGTGGTTRKALRREIGKMAGDFTLLIASSGTDGGMVDSRRLIGPNKAYTARTASFTGGTLANLGQTRRVLNSVQADMSIEWGLSLPASVQPGDEVELWGEHGMGFQPWEVDDMINSVVTDASTNVFVPVEASVTDAFDLQTGEITIPAAISFGIEALEYLPINGLDTWYPVEQSSSPGAAGWWVFRGLQKLIVGGDYWLGKLDGNGLRIKGYAIPASLDADTDTTSINKEFVVAESFRRLVRMSMNSSRRSLDIDRTTYQDIVRTAEIARQRAIMRPAGSWKRV